MKIYNQDLKIDPIDMFLLGHMITVTHFIRSSGPIAQLVRAVDL